MKSVRFLWTFLLCIPLSGMAQSSRERASSLYENAIRLLEQDALVQAVPVLLQSVAADTTWTEPQLTLAGVYARQKMFSNATLQYRSAFAKDPSGSRLWLPAYAAALAGEGLFSRALAVTDSFLLTQPIPEKTRALAETRRKNYLFGTEYASRLESSYRFDPINLGDSINSIESEYYPALSIDDSMLLFTRRTGGRAEVFLQSIKPGAKQFYSQARALPGVLNNEPFKGAINLAQDGEWLAFAGDFGPRGLGNFDIYFSRLTPYGWSEPQNAGQGVNSEFYETAPALSPDRQWLYFTSTRPGGYGGSDIWRSRQEKGRWTEAENLGPGINTSGDEQSPFVQAGGRHLYFSSNKLPGYGDHDLFVATQDSLGHFGNPVNLGFPINTIQHEGSLFVSSGGREAYYASDRSDTRGGLDLYRFTLPFFASGLPTTYLRGRVTDAITHNGLSGEVVLTNVRRQIVESRVLSDANGWFFITVPADEQFNFTVSRKGYWFYSDTSTMEQGPNGTKMIALQPLSPGSRQALRQIYFATNSARLEPVSLIELNHILQIMEQNPLLRLEIQGHTDATGLPAANQQLSQQRAAAVGRWLVAAGISQERLRAKGYGSAVPVADNKTEAGKAQNRRTELLVLEM